MAEWDNSTKEQVKKIPLLTENAGPRDAKEKWDARLKQVCRIGVRCTRGICRADARLRVCALLLRTLQRQTVNTAKNCAPRALTQT